jgi:Ca2+-binding RTX toxin-like protein
MAHTIDLTPDYFRADGNYFELSVSNLGNTTSTEATASIYVSRHSEVTTADTLMTSGSVAPIAGGSSAFMDLDPTYPTLPGRGHYYMAAIVDAGTSTDSNPANNVGTPQSLFYGGEGNDRFGDLPGSDVLTGDGNTAGDDVILGNGGDDTLLVVHGGLDVVSGGDGNDVIKMGSHLDDFDFVDGGAGTDTLILDGDYNTHGSSANAFDPRGIEHMRLLGGNSYDLRYGGDLSNAALATFTLQATALQAGDFVHFDGSQLYHPTKYVLNGGAGKDTLKGAGLHDVLTGGGGADFLSGGGGHDTYKYVAVSDSTGASYDTIVKFDGAHDHFAMPATVSGIDHAVTAGSLSTASFDSDLASAVGAGQLAAGHAVLFTANAGTLSGKEFLIVDANGQAGYQAGQDYVIEINALVNHLHVTSFT